MIPFIEVCNLNEKKVGLGGQGDNEVPSGNTVDNYVTYKTIKWESPMSNWVYRVQERGKAQKRKKKKKDLVVFAYRWQLKLQSVEDLPKIVEYKKRIEKQRRKENCIGKSPGGRILKYGQEKKKKPKMQLIKGQPKNQEEGECSKCPLLLSEDTQWYIGRECPG